MVERDFDGAKGPKAVGLSGSQFRFVVETFNHPGRDLLAGAKPIQQQFAVGTQRARDFFHWAQFGNAWSREHQ